MQVSVSTANFFPELSTKEAIAAVASTGTSATEIFAATPSEYESEFAWRLVDELSAHQLYATSLHPLGAQFEPQLFSRSVAQRKDARAMFAKVCRAARILGAPLYVFHGPSNLKHTPVRYDYPWLGAVADELCEMAEEQGVTLTWENVYWAYYKMPEFAPRVQEHMRAHTLCYTFDVKQAIHSGADPFAYLAQMGTALRNVHLCDIDQNGAHRLPGEGAFDWARLVRVLRDNGYDGHLCIEVYRECFQDAQELAAARRRVDAWLA